MSQLIEELLRALAAGYSDFSRGGHGQWTRKFISFISHKHLWLFLLGVQYAWVLDDVVYYQLPYFTDYSIPLFHWWTMVFIAWLTFFGVALGTGDPIGKIVEGHSEHGNDNNKLGKWEKWQYIINTDNAFTSHGLLGCLWVLPSLYIGIYFAVSEREFDWLYLFASNTTSFYTMGFVVRLMKKDVRWSHLEKLRTFGAMLLLQRFISI